MSYLVFRKYGAPFAAVEDATIDEAQAHIENGYGEYLDDFLSGLVTATIEESLPDFASPGFFASFDSAIARRATITDKDIIEKLYSHEKRINVLEGGSAGGWKEFTREVLLHYSGRLTVIGTKEVGGTVSLSGGGDIFVLGYRWYLPES